MVVVTDDLYVFGRESAWPDETLEMFRDQIRDMDEDLARRMRDVRHDCDTMTAPGMGDE